MTDIAAPRLPSVLLSVRLQNVRSFKEPTEFTMVASTMSDPAVVREVPLTDAARTVTVVPAAGVYGANGAGKTNLLRALHDLRTHVLFSFRQGNPASGVPRHPFLLDPEQQCDSSRFEIDLVLEGVRHEYSFEADDNAYLREWAYHYPRGRRALLFERIDEHVEFAAGQRTRGRAIAELLRPNALFLSTAAAAGHPALSPLYEWFTRNLILADARTRSYRQGYTTDMLNRPDRRESVLKVLQLADPGIVDATSLTIDPVMRDRVQRAVRIMMGQEGEVDSTDEVPMPDLGAQLVRQAVDGGRVEFESDDESLGTLVWFGVAGPVIDALADGCVFMADEIDASLHPLLTRQLVRVFQSPLTNPNRAQLIFNSHDTTLLGDSDDRSVGRDQVWLVEKDSEGASSLTQLSTLGERKDAALGRRYLSGAYGALPAITDDQFDAAILASIVHGRTVGG